MTALLSVASRGIRTQLLTSASIVSAVGASKIVLDVAPAQMEPPYIRIVHLYGGEENHNASRSFDITLRVDCVSRDYDEAEVIAGYIEDALVNTRPTLVDGWTTWHPVWQIFPYNNPILLNNEQFFSMGGQYRIRGVK